MVSRLRQSMLRTAAAGLVLLAALLGIGAAKADVPTCVGSDLLDELARTDPDQWQKVTTAGKRALNTEARLWRIEGKGAMPSYLLGTVHSTDPRITVLSPAIEAALNETRRIAIETTDLSAAAKVDAFKSNPDLVLYTDGRRIDGKLKPNEVQTVRARLAAVGLRPELVTSLRPWFVSMIISPPGCEQARQAAGLKVLDAIIADEGRVRGHAVIGLESVGEQLRALASMSEAAQYAMLRMEIAWSARSNDLLESVQQRYLRREMGAAWPLHLAMATKAGLAAQALRDFQTKVVAQRNLVMRDRSLGLLAEGRTLVAVGAMHLIGDNGLVALYRKAGYTVVPVE
jgi:uncharacterized protein YbaP (TraB family)